MVFFIGHDGFLRQIFTYPRGPDGEKQCQLDHLPSGAYVVENVSQIYWSLWRYLLKSWNMLLKWNENKCESLCVC